MFELLLELHLLIPVKNLEILSTQIVIFIIYAPFPGLDKNYEMLNWKLAATFRQYSNKMIPVQNDTIADLHNSKKCLHFQSNQIVTIQILRKKSKQFSYGFASITSLKRGKEHEPNDLIKLQKRKKKSSL